ncbi:FluG domain protein [Penicillium canariense]|uniref:FluG domain protein n=1 Tax=Penicillium canariense TaxID=189055 RepID=A0A9W9HVR3_9EURO|nr:FluG domain protein [Penicillium canariense]KAJ5159862.1 FluG domain protein [Penicillium canariense]
MPKKTGAKRTEIDWNLFVHQPDALVNNDHAEATKQNLKHIERNFRKLVDLSSHLSLTNNARFTQKLDPPNAQQWLKNITLRVVKGFLRWYLDNHNVEYQSTFLVFARYFRMYWCEEMCREFSYDLRRKMTMISISNKCLLLKLVCTTLTDEYELDLGGKTQLLVNIDDLLYSTYHLLAVCDIAFPTFRCRSQLSTLRKIMTSTSARPRTLIKSSGYMKSNDALKWKDIKLYIVKNPDNPICQVLLIRVTHRLNKGKRNKGVPIFSSMRFSMTRLQNLTKVPEHRLSTPIHFKETIKEIPIFRRAIKNEEGL